MSETWVEPPINPASEYKLAMSYWEPATRTEFRFNMCGSKYEFPRSCAYYNDNTGILFETTSEEIIARVEAGTWTNNDPILECLDGPEGCQGEVEYRYSGGTRHWPRCEKHGHERLKRQDEIDAKYPDSPIAPSWFDESYAGERWDEDY